MKRNAISKNCSFSIALPSLTPRYSLSIVNLRPKLRPQRPTQRHRERVRWYTHRNRVRRCEKARDSLLIDVPLPTEDHLLTRPQTDVIEALGLEAKHDGDFLDAVAGEDFVLDLRDSDLVQGLGLPDDLDFEGLEAVKVR